jgi:hypothetical protein
MQGRGLLPAHDELQEVLLVSRSSGPGHGRSHLHLPPGALLQLLDRWLRLQVRKEVSFIAVVVAVAKALQK